MGSTSGEPRPAPPWFPAARTHTTRGCLWGGPGTVLHAAQGLLDPARDLGDGEVMLASHFSDAGLVLEDIHDHGGLALRVPAFVGGFVVHLILLIAAL